MRASKQARWKRLIAASVVLGLLLTWSGSQAESNSGAGDVSVSKGFTLDPKSLAMAHDGWRLFRHGDTTLKFGAPAPAIHLSDVEWKQWSSDLLTFDFDKLKDRQILYVYYLSSPKAQKVDAVLDALEVALSAQITGELWMAIGVEYDTTAMQMLGDLYRKAAVPVEWSKETYEFIRDEHDPATIAELVSATAEALQHPTYRNFSAVEQWSALGKLSEAQAAVFNMESLPPNTVDVYWKTVSKGPLTWLDLKPVASFIALDRMLDIPGVDPEPVLTSKVAWQATGR